jgi:hypothetical protein
MILIGGKSNKNSESSALPESRIDALANLTYIAVRACLRMPQAVLF